MIYKLRKGIVVETICDTTMLVATLEARKYCPYVMCLNEDSAFIIQRIQEGKSIEEIAEDVEKEYEMPKSQALEILNTFLQRLKEKNYFEESNL